MDIGSGPGATAVVFAVACYGIRKLENAVDPVDRLREANAAGSRPARYPAYRHRPLR